MYLLLLSSPLPVSSDNSILSMAGSFPVHQGKELRWDQRLHLIGRPVLDPLLHICEVCDLPILIYGRMVTTGLSVWSITGVLSVVNSPCCS